MTPAGMTGALTHMLFHGVIKITLFFCAGAILVKTGQEYVQEVRGFGKVMPVTLCVFTIAALALTGVPPLPGFASKWNLATAAAADGQWFSYIGMGALIVSSVMTAIYLFTVIVPAYMMPSNQMQNAPALSRRDPGLCMKIPFAVLITTLIALCFCSVPVVQWLSNTACGLY